MNDPNSVVPLVSLAVPYGWRMVFLVNALAWTAMLAGLWTALDSSAGIWGL
jgi:hypothetical protein